MTSLRHRMLEDMQVRPLSPHTQRAYVDNVARFARYFGRSPADLGPEEIRTYQVYLTTERQLAPSSLVVAVSALRFLYRVTLTQPWSRADVIPAPHRPRPLPVVLSPEEVVQFLAGVKIPLHRTLLTTCYAAGLRISEAARLPGHLGRPRWREPKSYRRDSPLDLEATLQSAVVSPHAVEARQQVKSVRRGEVGLGLRVVRT